MLHRIFEIEYTSSRSGSFMMGRGKTAEQIGNWAYYYINLQILPATALQNIVVQSVQDQDQSNLRPMMSYECHGLKWIVYTEMIKIIQNGIS